MNYYQHHIGDFDRATRHLTRLERSIYRDLIELYYDTEQPLTLDRAALCRKIIANSNEEVTAVEQTLNEFFTETSTGWYHDRCETEIGRYHNSTSQKAVAGKASALKRAAKKQEALNGNPTAVEQALNGNPTNHKPITNNQEPIKSKSATATRLPADWKPSEADIEFCNHCRPDLYVQLVAEGFRDYWIAQPGAKGRKADWPATWRNWIRNQRQAQTTTKGQTRHEQLADKLADLTGAGRRNQSSDPRVIHGTAERLD